MSDTEDRILSVAVEVLGANPEAGIGEVAIAAGVVRRTVYGYFRTRADLVMALTRRAVRELETILTDVADPPRPADQIWAEFISQIWPLAHRYRVLVALRRGEFGADIHALLAPIDAALGTLVKQGQAAGLFGVHLPPDVLGQVAWAVVFSIADHTAPGDKPSARAATTSSLLLLGVPHTRAITLVDDGPSSTWPSSTPESPPPVSALIESPSTEPAQPQTAHQSAVTKIPNPTTPPGVNARVAIDDDVPRSNAQQGSTYRPGRAALHPHLSPDQRPHHR